MDGRFAAAVFDSERQGRFAITNGIDESLDGTGVSDDPFLEKATISRASICLSLISGDERERIRYGAPEALGWSGAELARRIDVGADRVSAWRCGKAKVPGAVVAYLRLAVSVRELLG